ncbi:MAG TPA: YqaE/Pmp3 family membrane protein [Polynucleobacter sp.]|nr:YqaE/Pmp3 family membrane protein [Polynucleobacter sp.]
MIFIAMFLFWLSLFLREKIFSGSLCVALQLMLIGWMSAAIWAVSALNADHVDKRHDKLIEAINKREK